MLVAAFDLAAVLFCLVPCRQSLQNAEDAAFTAPPFQNHEISTIDESSSSSSSTTSNNQHHPVRFLWGIMTTLRPKDAIHREVIRRTYLSYDSDRICSLSEANQKANSCQILYTFVVGANPNAPMDLVDYKNASHPLTLEGPLDDDSPFETDVTYLNIHENMEDGKMPSWFYYANTLVQDYHIDYIAKLDSDTLLFPKAFFHFVDTILPQPQQHPIKRVYGGIPYDSLNCGGYRREYCGDMVGATYMSGELYFMSADLSDFITSPDFNREAVRLPIEDMCTGNFVHSYPKPILEAVVAPHHKLWEHGDHLKEPEDYERRWDQHVIMEAEASSHRPTSTTKFAMRGTSFLSSTSKNKGTVSKKPSPE
jgi:hypothetical protein